MYNTIGDVALTNIACSRETIYTRFIIRTILQEQRGSNLAKNLEQRKNNPGWDLES